MSASNPATPKITRRGFLRAGVRSTIGLCGLGLGSLAWATREDEWLEINQIEVKMPYLPTAFDGYRIAQLSDIHIEGGAMRTWLPQIAHEVTALGADAIVLTGDYVTVPGDWQENPLVEGLKHLRARDGVFAVLGNHDHWHMGRDRMRGPQMVRSALKRAGIEELRNSALPIKRQGERLWMCGIDDWITGYSDLDAVSYQFPPQSAAVLLAHEPDYADHVAATNRYGLMLSGHSHGGQIALPFLGPIVTPRGSWKYQRGRYQVQNMTLYTNRGVGTVGIPLRFCARPEIAVFTLRCE